MLKINDYVIYNLIGVCKIIDITEGKDIHDVETEYYVLQPVCNSNLIIKCPVNGPKILIRKIISKNEALSLIETIPETETVWIENNRERNVSFKAALKTGDSEEWMKLLKTLYVEKQEKSDAGKKLCKSDEDIMKTVERNLFEEFAIALDILPDQVSSLIEDRIS